MSEVSDEFQELVRKNGDEVAMDEPPCVIWKAEHETCPGCPYELGCGKMVKLMIIAMLPMIYESKDFNDFSNMQARIKELGHMILAAKTPDELKAVPDA